MLEGFQSRCKSNARIIVSKDTGTQNKAKHIADNPAEQLVRQYKLDDYIRNIPCCDFALLNDDLRHIYLIELKGSDPLYAKEQLESAHHMLEDELNGYVFFFRCIYQSGVHGLQSRKLIQIKKMYGTWKGHAIFEFKRNQMEECINI